MNLFVSNPLVFSFESNDENYFYGVTIISSSMPALQRGATMSTIKANWGFSFVVYNLQNPKEESKVDVEEAWPWS